MPTPHTCAVSSAPCAACAENRDQREGVVRVAAHRCLECGAHLDAIGVSQKGLPASVPEPGDPVACIRCGAVMTWENDKLRGFTDVEMDALIADRGRIDELARLVRGIRFVSAARN